jgi:hypothetical protein
VTVTLNKFVKLVTADKDKSAGITLGAGKSVALSKTVAMGYLSFDCAAVTAGTYLYVNLTGTDKASYTSANSITVAAVKAGTELKDPPVTVTYDAASSKPASTAVKAKCPSLG